MEILGNLCLVIAVLISAFYGVMLLIAAFRQHVLWGLGCLFIPVVTLVFIVTNWEVARKPFLRGLIAIPFTVVGLLLSPGMMAA